MLELLNISHKYAARSLKPERHARIEVDPYWVARRKSIVELQTKSLKGTDERRQMMVAIKRGTEIRAD